MDPSLRALTTTALEALEALGAALEPDRLFARDALWLFSSLDRLVRLADGAKTLLAGRLAASSAASDAGFRDVAEQLATIEGTSKAKAKRRLAQADAVATADQLESALRGGELSAAQTEAITDALTKAPEAEAHLIETARDEPLFVLKDACREAKATGTKADPAATRRAIHHGRFFRHYTDDEGAFCFAGRDLPERGARLVGLLEDELAQMTAREADGAGGAHTEAARDDTPYPAQLLDALFSLLATRTDQDPKRPSGPKATVLVRVDLEALQRRQVERGDVASLEGHAPLCAKSIEALLSDAFVAYVFHRAGDIAAVYHHGRTINATLRTALFERDRCCVVPGCGVRHGLEIDHVVPFATGGPTTLSNLARLCHHHHFLKTFEDWRLTRHDPPEGGPPTWSFVPPEELVPFGEEDEDLHGQPARRLEGRATGPPG